MRMQSAKQSGRRRRRRYRADMLCRAVLTAVAISCTFPPAVIGQGSPRKVQIKDLICVLWLSGMQREDLDVNMLRKLQRHNVNIDDMDRESLKRQCLDFQSNKDNATRKVNNAKGDDVENKTSTVKLDKEKEVNKLIKSAMILTDLVDSQTIKAIENKSFLNNNEVKYEPKVQNVENIQNKNTDLFNVPLEIEKSEKFGVKQSPNLENIIHFWKKFTTNSPDNYIETKIKKPKSNSSPVFDGDISEQKFMKKDRKTGMSKQAEYIDKLLEDIINRSAKPTTEKPTTSSVDLKKLSDQIEKLLQLYPQRGTLGNSNNFPESEVEIINDLQPDGYYFVKNGIPIKSRILDERIKQYDNRERRIENNDIKESNSRLLPIDFPKNIATFPTRNRQHLPRDIAQKYQLTERYKDTSEPTHTPSARVTVNDNNMRKNDSVKIITKDVIKEIAENVKAIVLKDLRQEMTSTPSRVSVGPITVISAPTSPKISSTTKLTTETTSKIPPQNNKTQEANQVITKFMELFEQFKTINERIEVPSNINTLLANVTRQKPRNPFNFIHRIPPKVAIDPYRLKPPEITPGLFNPFGIQRPRVQNIQIQRAKFVQNSLAITPQTFHVMRAKPITIQTNSDEIAPLGIPIEKPLKIIHQNIVVTTAHPLVTRKHHIDKWVDQYEHKDRTKSKERHKYYSNPPTHERYKEAKPKDRWPNKESRLREFDKKFRDEETRTLDQGRYRDERSREFKYSYKDNTKSSDQRLYKSGRSQDFKIPPKEDATQTERTSQKDSRPTVFKYETKPADDRYYEGIKYSNRENNHRMPYKSPYDEVINMKLNENAKDYGNDKKYLDNVSYGLLSPRHRDPTRFHEKLERVDDWQGDSRSEGKNCRDKLSVASRQQQPLNMKDPRFDDTHFKNFLKTQQKVNDMLEKILSSKTIQNGPRSVETT